LQLELQSGRTLTPVQALVQFWDTTTSDFTLEATELELLRLALEAREV
jgi:hypothetical protein